MLETFEEIDDPATLEAVLRESDARPVVLFKHSLLCPISRAASFEMDAQAAVADDRARYHLVVMQHARDVSDEIARVLEIPHASPQVLIVRHGAVVWSASHWGITRDAVDAAVRRAADMN